ncbi:hypothetical protein E3N88_26546 [Mikania micrantha]|uniref:Uncharacterized protein n=1 Tax=Mikania micrantha TaxID=192012 RepID=A0A5N6MWT2_9ASTR|nr:hypothetical protein E3N88_26546 [Mikania micrantha]
MQRRVPAVQRRSPARSRVVSGAAALTGRGGFDKHTSFDGCTNFDKLWTGMETTVEGIGAAGENFLEEDDRSDPYVIPFGVRELFAATGDCERLGAAASAAASFLSTYACSGLCLTIATIRGNSDLDNGTDNIEVNSPNINKDKGEETLPKAMSFSQGIRNRRQGIIAEEVT